MLDREVLHVIEPLDLTGCLSPIEALRLSEDYSSQTIENSELPQTVKNQVFANRQIHKKILERLEQVRGLDEAFGYKRESNST